MMNEGSAQTPESVSQQVYAASQQGDPTDFLLWHATPGISKNRDPGRVSLLHSVSYYTSWKGRPASCWENHKFVNRGDVSYVTAPLTVWDTTYLHLAPAIYVPSAATIDTSLSGNPTINLLGPYGAGDAGAEVIRFCKTVYVPDPYVGLFLGNNLTPVEAWNRFRGAISDAATEAACRSIIDWLRTTIVRSGPVTYSALVVFEPSSPLPNALLLQHRHRLLLIHLPGIDPSINSAAGTRIEEMVGEVGVELRETWLENKRVW